MSHKAQIVLNKLLARVGIAVLHFFKVLFFLRGRQAFDEQAKREIGEARAAMAEMEYSEA